MRYASAMKQDVADVVIVGAGIAGLSLGLALAQAGRRVQIVDARAPAPATRVAGQFDQRIYALGPANVAWLDELRVWAAVDAARVLPVHDMRVFGDAPLRSLLPALGARGKAGDQPVHAIGQGGGPAEDQPGQHAANAPSKAAVQADGLHLSAYRSGLAELCWIVEESEIARVLESAAGFTANLEVLRPAQPAALVQEADSVQLRLADGRICHGRLLVACDGASSWVRGAAGIGTDLTPYGETAVVANFHAALPHRNCAYQWFRREEDGSAGILAWLPLPDGQVSMVWSVTDARAEQLLGMESHALAAEAARAGGATLGAFSPAGPAAGFKLKNLRARALIAPRVALAGDAAHVVHPLVGQGLNLGLGDVRALAAALAHQPDCGAFLTLRAYERARKAAILEMHAVTHGLDRLFSATHPLARAVRNIGLNLTARLPVLPQLIARHATR